MAGFFSRLTTLLKANINDLISRAEDPEKILNQLIIEMREQLIEAKKLVAVAIADEKKLRKQLDNESKMAKEWEKKAMLAVRAGRDDLAMEALQRKEQHEKLTSEYQAQWQMQKKAADQLRVSLRMLNSKIEEAKRKKELLIARKRRVEAQKRIQETMGGLGDTSAFDAFEKMSSKIDQMEAEVEAVNELNREELGVDLNDKFAALEADAGASEALLALKAKMGMVAPAPEPTVVEEEEEEEFSFEQMEAELAAISAGSSSSDY